MNTWVIGLTLLALPPSQAQNPCPAGRPPVRIISNLVSVLGQSPIWAATGGKPIEWESPAAPARVLWLRDVAARGIAFLSGKLSGTESRTAPKVSFGTSLYGAREPRLKLDHIGVKPAGIKDGDLQKYAFNWTFVWFPSPGCYEITGSVGSRQSIIHLNVTPAASKKKST